MSKVRKNFSLPYELAQELDNKLEDGQKSEFVAQALEKQLEMDFSKDEELARKKQAVKEKLEDLRDEKQGIENEINQAEAELKAIESALEKKEEKKGLLHQAVHTLAPKFKDYIRKGSGITSNRGKRSTEEAFKLLFASESFGMWEEKINASRQDLKQAVKSEVKNKYPEEFEDDHDED